jgi:hypothetical protein
MALNVGLEALVGVVPIIGDLFDAAWKANQRNVALPRQYAAVPHRAHVQSRFVVVAWLAALLAGATGVAILAYASSAGSGSRCNREASARLLAHALHIPLMKQQETRNEGTRQETAEGRRRKEAEGRLGERGPVATGRRSPT